MFCIHLKQSPFSGTDDIFEEKLNDFHVDNVCTQSMCAFLESPNCHNALYDAIFCWDRFWRAGVRLIRFQQFVGFGESGKAFSGSVDRCAAAYVSFSKDHIKNYENKNGYTCKILDTEINDFP